MCVRVCVCVVVNSPSYHRPVHPSEPSIARAPHEHVACGPLLCGPLLCDIYIANASVHLLSPPCPPCPFDRLYPHRPLLASPFLIPALQVLVTMFIIQNMLNFPHQALGTSLASVKSHFARFGLLDKQVRRRGDEEMQMHMIY